jgi:hypothetical protein
VPGDVQIDFGIVVSRHVDAHWERSKSPVNGANSCSFALDNPP